MNEHNRTLPEALSFNDRQCTVLKALGHGKSGDCYLVSMGQARCVVVQLDRDCGDSDSWGKRLAGERRDYRRLVEARIRVPELIEVDEAHGRLLRAYIPGPTAFELVRDDGMRPEYLNQVRAMAALAREAGLNLDYLPENFVVYDGQLYYVEYRCADYRDDENFDNLGARYWKKTRAFLERLERRRREPGERGGD